MGRRDNPFSDNPFGKFEGEQNDPFKDQPVPAADSGAWTEDANRAWGSSVSPATIPIDTDHHANGDVESKYSKRKEQLDLKEKELNAREAELQKRAEELKKSGALKPPKNWPKFYPITYHDIDKEVPAENRKMVKFCYYAFLAFILCVTVNWFGALFAMCVISPGSGRLVGFLLAAIYFFAGIPGAWILWYMRLYNLAIKDRALVYAWFFLMFAAHIAFCIWSAISPPLPFTNDWSHTGFVTCIKAFDASTFVGVWYVIGGSLWSLESLWSIFAMGLVYRHFRSGTAPQRMKQEAIGAAGQAALSRKKPNFGAGDV